MTDDAAATERNLRPIAGWIAVQLVAGLVAGCFSADQVAVSSGLFFGLVTGQTSLLGMWAGLGGNHWALRAVGLAAGTVYLALLLGLGIGEPEMDIFFVVALATLLVAAVTWLVRWWTGPIRRYGAQTEGVREGLQFTIRHLMLLTLIVACLVSAGKLAAPHFRGLHNTTQLTLIAVCFVGVSLTAIWSTLGLGPPLIRGAILLLLTGGLGYALGYVIERQYVFWIAVAVVQATWSAGSLLVLRAWGYRLLRRTNRAGEQLPTTDL